MEETCRRIGDGVERIVDERDRKDEERIRRYEVQEGQSVLKERSIDCQTEGLGRRR